jgi:hypothetical protein
MPNGRPGDAPWTDFFVHGRDLFPEDISAMLRAIARQDAGLIRHLAHPDMWDWAEGKNLEEGREKLRQIIRDNRVPYAE